MVVCFEALAALAPVLRLDCPDHPPNHRRLEKWLVHVPPRLYSRYHRARMMWILHTIVSCGRISTTDFTRIHCLSSVYVRAWVHRFPLRPSCGGFGSCTVPAP